MTEIVVKIPDDLHETIIDPDKWLTPKRVNKLVDAVLHGTELPKGHGNLKDASLLREKYHTVFNDDLGIFEDVVNIADIDLAETLVEADKGEE